MNSTQLKIVIQQLNDSLHNDPGVRASQEQAIALYQIAYVLTALNEQQNPAPKGFAPPAAPAAGL
jgi:hypothetical protein